MKNKRDRNLSSFSSRLLRLARQPDKAYKTGRITAEFVHKYRKKSFLFFGAHTSHQNVSMHLFSSVRSRDQQKQIFQRKKILGFILQIDSIYFYTQKKSVVFQIGLLSRIFIVVGEFYTGRCFAHMCLCVPFWMCIGVNGLLHNSFFFLLFSLL